MSEGYVIFKNGSRSAIVNHKWLYNGTVLEFRTAMYTYRYGHIYSDGEPHSTTFGDDPIFYTAMPYYEDEIYWAVNEDIDHIEWKLGE